VPLEVYEHMEREAMVLRTELRDKEEALQERAEVVEHLERKLHVLSHAKDSDLRKVETKIRGHTLQHAATQSNTVQHTAIHCSTLQHTATHGSTLQRTATHCNTLQHTATHCNTLHILSHAQDSDTCKVFV